MTTRIRTPRPVIMLTRRISDWMGSVAGPGDIYGLGTTMEDALRATVEAAAHRFAKYPRAITGYDFKIQSDVAVTASSENIRAERSVTLRLFLRSQEGMPSHIVEQAEEFVRLGQQVVHYRPLYKHALVALNIADYTTPARQPLP